MNAGTRVAVVDRARRRLIGCAAIALLGPSVAGARPASRIMRVAINHLGPWTPEVNDVQLAAATRLGLELVRIDLPANSAYPAIERAIRKAKIDLLCSTGGEQWAPDLMRFLERARIPADWTSPEYVRQGGLLSSLPSWDGQYRIAVTIVARVLRGENPATIPVHAPTSFTTAINLRTARAMGLTVPPSILLRADVVFDE